MSPTRLPKPSQDPGWRADNPGRGWENQNPLSLPPISWGSPRLVPEAVYDRLNRLNGTWSEEVHRPPLRGSSFHSLLDLEDSAIEPGTQTTRSGEGSADQSVRLTVKDRTVSRPRTSYRPILPARVGSTERSNHPPVYSYRSTLCEAASLHPGLWDKQTPVSGGTGLRVITKKPGVGDLPPVGDRSEVVRGVCHQREAGDVLPEQGEDPGVRVPGVDCPARGARVERPHNQRSLRTSSRGGLPRRTDHLDDHIWYHSDI